MNLRHLTFRLLQVYVTVVKTGSVTAAAQRLHLTQPTVSQQLKRLAESVGEPLLHHDRGRIELTEAGIELYRAALDVTGRFEDFADYLGGAGRWPPGAFQHRPGEHGAIRVTAGAWTLQSKIP